MTNNLLPEGFKDEVSTNASISSTGVTSSIGDSLTWYVGLDQTNFFFSGQEGAQINVTLVHPAGPSPGIYLVGLLYFQKYRII